MSGRSDMFIAAITAIVLLVGVLGGMDDTRESDYRFDVR